MFGCLINLVVGQFRLKAVKSWGVVYLPFESEVGLGLGIEMGSVSGVVVGGDHAVSSVVVSGMWSMVVASTIFLVWSRLVKDM